MNSNTSPIFDSDILPTATRELFVVPAPREEIKVTLFVPQDANSSLGRLFTITVVDRTPPGTPGAYLEGGPEDRGALVTYREIPSDSPERRTYDSLSNGSVEVTEVDDNLIEIVFDNVSMKPVARLVGSNERAEGTFTVSGAVRVEAIETRVVQ